MKKILLMLILFPMTVLAEVFHFSSVFSDNMVLQQNKTVNIWGWADKGKLITLKTGWNNKTYTTYSSEDDGKWVFKVKTPKASFNEYDISASDGIKTIKLSNILSGEVWLCSGQSNMEMIMRPQPEWRLKVENAEEEMGKADYPFIRYITAARDESYIPMKEIWGNKWKVVSPSTIGDMSAVAYYFAKRVQASVDVPIGLIIVAYGGSSVQSWLPTSATYSFLYDTDKMKLDKYRKEGNKKPYYEMLSALYNGMLNGVVGYGIKGILWYQGECNVGDNWRYPYMIKDLVKSWRNIWDENLPFYYVQIAPYKYEDYKGGQWASFAYNQECVQKEIPNSGIVITSDIGDPDNPHPARKKPVGERLALMALNNIYKNDVFCNSPVVKKAERSNDLCKIEFGNSYGKMHIVGKANEFEISEDGKIFYKPEIIVDGKYIILKCKEKISPKIIRYCWRDDCASNVYNSADLPLGPFNVILND